MKHFHGLEKYQMADKLFGVYDHALPNEASRLMQGFTDSFRCPYRATPIIVRMRLRQRPVRSGPV